MVVLLRVWMQWARCDFYNPFSQFVVKVTQPVVGPLRRIIPAMGPIDSASLLVAFILCVVKAIVLFMVVTFQPIIWISALLILIKPSAADLLGAAADGDHELGKPGP
jgi:YggT family protein